MSLRKQAIILRIAPSYLGTLINGKSKLPDALMHRYEELVNSVINTPDANAFITNGSTSNLYQEIRAQGGSRTHTPSRGADFKSAASTLSPPGPGTGIK